MREVILSLLLLHLAACSSMQTIPLQDLQGRHASSALQIGDRVELDTTHNETLDFAVTDITEDGLSGKFGFIPYQDIRRLRAHRAGSGEGENLSWLWGALGLAALVALIVSADSVTFCSGTPCQPPQPSH